MKLPISWLKDFIDLQGLAIEEIARLLTLAGLEVAEITYAGLEMPAHREGEPREFKTRGIAWDRDKIVVAEVREVKAHPNADRLTLLDLHDGTQAHTVLTGAPNIFHLKGKGKLPRPLKIAYAREGATLYDGHAEGLQLMTLKRATIRGVDSYSMACSEKELGISDDHEGIILLDEDAPVGTPLADYMGDAVLDFEIQPNMARNTNVLGVARELAALTGRNLIQPRIKYKTSGESIKELVSVQITEPELNPRFVLGLVRNVRIGPSPYEVRRRLKLAGMRPINCIVDATNYAMLEIGEPLHAFDFDALQRRAGKGRIKIITRPAKNDEVLETLDGVKRRLSPLNVLVCDAQGPLSVAGVMGGSESEVTENTRNVLLEGAAWNFINIRRTARDLSLTSEASFRFSRGVHPALALTGVQRGGQIYVGPVNWSLMVASCALVVGFGSSANLAAAYGMAVTATMLITTLLLCVVARRRWGWKWGSGVLVLAAAFLPVDLAFLGANLLKLDDGGWFSLLIAAVGFALMSTWKRGRGVLRERLEETGLPLELFLPDLETNKLPRVPGTAVFLAGDPSGTPLALLHNVKHNKVVHELNVLLTLVTDDVPYVPEPERATVKPLGQGFFRVVAHHGFMDMPDVPALLRQVRSAALPIELERTSYFLGRERLIPAGRSGMARWREWLFSVMSQNAQSATTYFRIPPNQVVELGAQVEL